MSYNRTWIENRFTRKSAWKFFANELLTREQLVKSNEVFRDNFYSPNFFVRIGLFIFSQILVAASLGIAGTVLFTFSSDEAFIGIVLLIAAALMIYILEYFIKSKNHFRSGMDDYFLYAGVGFAISGLVIITGNYNTISILLITIPVMIFAIIRYSDAMLALIAFICTYVLVFILFTDYLNATSFLPFIFFFLSVSVFIYIQKSIDKKLSEYYSLCLKVLKVASLICIYLSMNYFVVKEGNILLNESTVSSQPTEEMQQVQSEMDLNSDEISRFYNGDSTITEDRIAVLEKENLELYAKSDSLYNQQYSEIRQAGIPFGFIFYGFTFLLPIAYIYFGLKRKDRILLDCGLLISAAAACNFLYLNDRIGYDIFMVITGAFMLLVVWLAIRYIKGSNTGFSYKEPKHVNPEDMRNIEAIALANSLGQTPVQENTGVEFGGGKYGGGGAGGAF